MYNEVISTTTVFTFPHSGYDNNLVFFWRTEYLHHPCNLTLEVIICNPTFQIINILCSSWNFLLSKCELFDGKGIEIYIFIQVFHHRPYFLNLSNLISISLFNVPYILYFIVWWEIGFWEIKTVLGKQFNKAF